MLFRHDDEDRIAQFYVDLCSACEKSPDPETRFEFSLLDERECQAFVTVGTTGRVSTVQWLSPAIFDTRWSMLWSIDVDAAEPRDEYFVGWIEGAGIRVPLRNRYVACRPVLEKFVRKFWDTGVPEELAELIIQMKPWRDPHAK